MFVSTLDLFSIGIGPSSSHTVGPMRAAFKFISELSDKKKLKHIQTLKIELFGSLAMTGVGHGTHLAIFLGLHGEKPETCDPEFVDPFIRKIADEKKIELLKSHKIDFNPEIDLIFHYGKRLPHHSNGMKFSAYNDLGKIISQEVMYSVGGGFIATKAEMKNSKPKINATEVPYPFSTFEQLKTHAVSNNLSIDQIMMSNELSVRSQDLIDSKLLNIWNVMKACVKRGCSKEGILPGGLFVKRRAPYLFAKLSKSDRKDPLEIMDWVSLYALAVNEENAAGSQVVTAPTNGASGVIPAVLHYYDQFVKKMILNR